jgi:hypothetical protein
MMGEALDRPTVLGCQFTRRSQTSNGDETATREFGAIAGATYCRACVLHSIIKSITNLSLFPYLRICCP